MSQPEILIQKHRTEIVHCLKKYRQRKHHCSRNSRRKISFYILIELLRMRDGLIETDKPNLDIHRSRYTIGEIG